MPKPIVVELRKRAVAAYEAGEASFDVIADRSEFHVEACSVGSSCSVTGALLIPNRREGATFRRLI